MKQVEYNILKRHKALGLSQSKLAELMGISPTYLSLLEQQKRSLSDKMKSEFKSSLTFMK